jgi:putative hydrolase of the HAD superfamily
MFTNIKVIGFDADDTLWVNEPYFKEIETKFCELVSSYVPDKKASEKLFETEINNLNIYGYGVKAFILSLIETAIKVSNSKIPNDTILKIIDLGKELLNKNIELLDGIKTVLDRLSKKDYRLIVATKGDLLDQERKLKKSGLEKYFHHIEIMSDKKESDYLKLIKHLDIHPSEFIMIGNSLKSDILPVLNIGSKAIHIPYHTTWTFEHVSDKELKNNEFLSLDKITEILNFL